MDIKQKPIDYKCNLPFEAQICHIRNTEAHFHAKDLELIYCLEGHVDLVAGHQRTRINQGEIFSVDYWDIHHLVSNVDNTVLIFHLDLTRSDLSWERLEHVYFCCESCHCLPYQKAAMDKVIDIITALSLIHFKENALDINTKSVIASYNSLIELLYTSFTGYNYESQDAYINEDIRERYYRILAYCNKHYKEKITIAKVAESEHLNQSYFSQFFKNTIFMSFSDLLGFIRSYNAEHLLLTSDLSIYEISFACGFSDPKYLYPAFKKWFGCTPHQHKQTYKDYMKLPPSYSFVSNTESENLLIEQITARHIKKSLEYRNSAL